MCQLDGYLLDNDLYTYAPIDWEALGAEIKPTPRVQNPLFEKTLEDLYEESNIRFSATSQSILYLEIST